MCSLRNHIFIDRKMPAPAILVGQQNKLLDLANDSIPYKEKKKLLVQHGPSRTCRRITETGMAHVII